MTNQNIHIQKATEKHLEKIYVINKEFAGFQRTPEKFTITLQQMKDAKDSFHFLVAINENEDITGFASFFIAYYSWSGKALFLDDLYVRENYRKQKIGLRLLQSVINYAKEINCTKVKWQVSKWNENAISFYKKMGASIDEVEINCELSLT